MYDRNSCFHEGGRDVVNETETVDSGHLEACLELAAAVFRPLNIAPAAEFLRDTALHSGFVVGAVDGVYGDTVTACDESHNIVTGERIAAL